MKCNLVPPACRQLQRLWMRPVCLGLCLMLAVCLGLALFFQYQLRCEKTYYTDCLYPRQQQIHDRNEAIRRGQALVDRDASRRQETLFTPALVAALAASKPEGLVVHKVSGQAGRVVVEGLAAAANAPQAWQRTLQQQGLGQVAVTKMQPDKGQGIPFSLEVSRHETMATAG